jgi:hypothetical protein
MEKLTLKTAEPIVSTITQDSLKRKIAITDLFNLLSTVENLEGGSF